MQSKRGSQTKRAFALVAVCIALLALWWVAGGPGDTSGETPGRTAGQTSPPSGTELPSEQPASAGSTTTTAQPGDGGVDPVSGLPWVALGELPLAAEDTLEEIEAGPPYPYERDGVTFENREGLLPDEEYGYYQEFTVPTPGSSDRGARRIIWGLEDELYYTGDHYQSFVRIQP